MVPGECTVYPAMCRELLVFLAILIAAESLEISLNGDWTVTNSNGSISVPAKVPGGIYTDLARANVIADPYYRYNDLNTRWVSYDSWTWTKNFQVPASILSSANLNLILHGIDTAANVSLNGQQIAFTSNMFVRYCIDVRNILKEQNTISVRIESPVLYALTQFTDFYNKNYTVYPTSVPKVQKGENHVNFIRKMQSSFSWDWGPAFPSMGIWQNIALEYHSDPILRDVTVGLQDNDDLWNITLGLYVEGNSLPDQVDVSCGLLEVEIYKGKASVVNGKAVITNININQNKVRRWWPNGYGDQQLYNLTVTIGATEKSTKMITIGFRTVELVQNPIPGVTGLSFYFKVNGWSIFSKGSNMIPMDVLPERVSKDKIMDLMQSAKDANMNMLRIWGGGIYEHDYVYEMADRMGILIWQDMMFACALYPTNKEFLDNVSEEVSQQVRRLQHHPSIALWAGNNENEIAIASYWWPQMIFQASRYHDDYRTLYVYTIKPIIEEIDPWGTYLTSSPTNGKMSEQEGYLSSDPGSNIYGDVHYYSYLSDSWNPVNYPVARFVSEFGLQSFPTMQTWQQATNLTSDLVFPLSDLMGHRQHHSVGNSNIERKVYSKMNGPRTVLSSGEQFRIFCYLTQIHQAVSIKTAVEKFRRDRTALDKSSGEGHTMGALYWQLNDIWQAPTWASLEYDGTWKMLHNYAKNFFEPVLISVFQHKVSWTAIDNIQVWLISDIEEPLANVTVTLTAYSFQSFEPVRNVSVTTTMCADCSMLGQTINTADFFKSPCSIDTCFAIASLQDSHGELISDNSLLVEIPKKIKNMMSPELEVASVEGPHRRDDGRVDFSISLKATAPAPFTWLDAIGTKGHFTDNGFFIYRPQTNVTFVTSDTTLTSMDIMQRLRLTAYRDSVDFS